MTHDDHLFDDRDAPRRPRYRPPVGLPVRKEDYKVGTIVSVGLHALVLLLILMPIVVAGILAAPPTGAGGAGPAGGGGGGTRGSGGGPAAYIPERLRYIWVGPVQTPATPAAEPEPVQPEPPPEPDAEPEPEKTPPVSQNEPTPPAEPTTSSADAQADQPADVLSALPGSGGGTGDDGTAGTGPGSGGGVGSGIGTGRGSGEGPGTGGGTGDVYLPTPTLSVYPHPNRKPRTRVPGDTIQVLFDVDSTGRVLRIEFPPTRDRGFDKYLVEVLTNWKFRPAVRQDGTPVRATYPLVLAL